MTNAQNIKSYLSPNGAARAINAKSAGVLFSGDCLSLLKEIPSNTFHMVVTSPPYCMGKEYETSNSVHDFIEAHKVLLPEIVRITRPGGSICWQVGYHVKQQSVYPLDYAVFSLLEGNSNVILRNRIIWSFAHGLHGSSRFSGRHETILWYTKGENFTFNLDAVRIPQKYPGKRHYKGPNRGELSGNPKGKNPGDVWDIPNVKGNHVEKVEHPCQFPVALIQRLIRGLTPRNGLIFDPFMGSGSTGVAAAIERRRFVGAEIDPDYVKIAKVRISEAYAGKAKFRPLEKPIYMPSPGLSVAQRPEHFTI